MLCEPRLPLKLPSVGCGLEGLGKNFRWLGLGVRAGSGPVPEALSAAKTPVWDQPLQPLLASKPTPVLSPLCALSPSHCCGACKALPGFVSFPQLQGSGWAVVAGGSPMFLLWEGGDRSPAPPEASSVEGVGLRAQTPSPPTGPWRWEPPFRASASPDASSPSTSRFEGLFPRTNHAPARS